MSKDPTTMGFKMLADPVARLRAAEKRECPDYKKCFEEAVRENTKAVPCRSCPKNLVPVLVTKHRKKYEKTEIQRSAILDAMEQVIKKDGVATQEAIAAWCRVSIENLRYHLKKMAKEQIIKINPPNFRDGLESSTVEYLTPPHDATLPDKASQGDNLTEKAGKDALVDENERKVSISLHSTAPAPEPIFVAGQRLPEKEAAIIREKINMTSPAAPGDAIMPPPELTPAPEPEATSAPGRISAAPEKSADPALRNIAISVNKAIEVALLEQVILMEKLKEFDSLRERIRRLEQFIEAAQKLMSEW